MRWVGKHDDLPTSKLILVSEKGFTQTGRELAIAKGAVPIAPEDLGEGRDEQALIHGMRSLWPKHVTFTVETLSVKFAEPAPDSGLGSEPPLVGILDGRVLGNLQEVVENLYHANFMTVMSQAGLANMTQDQVKRWTLRIEPAHGHELTLPIDGEPRTLYLVNANHRGYALTGKAKWLDGMHCLS